MTAWLALYGSAKNSAALKRIFNIYARRLKSNLAHAFGQLLTRHDAATAAEGMAAMIDGLWLQYALRGGEPDPGHARLHLQAYVDMQLTINGPKQ